MSLDKHQGIVVEFVAEIKNRRPLGGRHCVWTARHHSCFDRHRATMSHPWDGGPGTDESSRVDDPHA